MTTDYKGFSICSGKYLPDKYWVDVMTESGKTLFSKNDNNTHQDAIDAGKGFVDAQEGEVK